MSTNAARRDYEIPGMLNSGAIFCAHMFDESHVLLAECVFPFTVDVDRARSFTTTPVNPFVTANLMCAGSSVPVHPSAAISVSVTA